MTQRWSFILIAISVLIFIGPARANDKELTTAASAVHAGVYKYLSELVEQQASEQKQLSGIEIEVTPIHPRLKLQSCDTALNFETTGRPRIPGRLSVKVSCHSGAYWSLYVTATVSWYQSVVMAKHSLFKAQQIGADDIYTTDVKMTRTGTRYLSSVQQVVGKVVKRQLSADKPIDPRYLQQANLVSKGDSIVLIAKTGSIAVRSTGVALGSGMAGQQIDVENSISRRVVKARIVGRGQAQVLM